MNALLNEYLSRIDLGEPQQFKNIVIVPVSMPAGQSPDYLTLTEALGKRIATITEVSSGGTVPEVQVVNSSDLFLLLLDGEELVGARQNRTLNTSILLRGRSELVVPVSCTERGRWAHKTLAFADAGFVSPHKLRKTKSDSVRASLLRKLGHSSNQAAVWEQVDHMFACLQTSSPTSAMADAMAEKAQELQDYLRNMKPLPGQTGLAVLIDGEVAGFDAVSSPRAYQVLHSKLIRSYAADALLSGKDVPVEKPRDKVQLFLESSKASSESVHPAVGCGEDHRFQGPALAGAALVFEGSVLHLNLYRN